MATIAMQTRLTDDEAKQRDELLGRLCGAFIGALDLASVYLGDKLGLYRALRDDGPATSAQLARRTGISERYAREWLEQQAATAIVTVDDATAEPDARTYALSRGHAEALTDRDSTSCATPMAIFLAPLGTMLPRLVDAYRTGEGISWSDYGDDCWQAQGDFNRPYFRAQLAEQFAKLPVEHARLDAGGRLADIACGVGWSSIAIAKAYPNARVDGFDLDAKAIGLARDRAVAEGVADRVAFHATDASTVKGRYDVVTIFEALHDMSQPVEVLRAAREVLAPDGSVIVADENFTDTFNAPGNDVERILYGASVTFCLPNGLADRPSAATGAAIRPATVKRYAMAAGFTTFEELPLELGLLRFYRISG